MLSLGVLFLQLKFHCYTFTIWNLWTWSHFNTEAWHFLVRVISYLCHHLLNWSTYFCISKEKRSENVWVLLSIVLHSFWSPPVLKLLVCSESSGNLRLQLNFYWITRKSADLCQCTTYDKCHKMAGTAVNDTDIWWKTSETSTMTLYLIHVFRCSDHTW